MLYVPFGRIARRGTALRNGAFASVRFLFPESYDQVEHFALGRGKRLKVRLSQGWRKRTAVLDFWLRRGQFAGDNRVVKSNRLVRAIAERLIR